MEVSNTDKRRGSVPDFGMDSPTRTRSPLSRSRAGTLSWQQRPSRDFAVSPGSTSPTRSPTRASHLRNLSTASDENSLSRLQFGFPRPSKDAPVLPPSPDRGVGSLAHSAKEEQTDSQTDVGVGHQEPEAGEESSTELDKLEAVEERSSSPPRTGSRDSNMSHRFSVSSVSAGLGSPVHLSETPKLEPRQNDSSLEESVSPSPAQRRLSPERTRSTSPTKGLGGFVQSAMMRRSDSVSKRWSAQVPQGLGRSNSIVSNRSSVAGPSLSEMTPPTLGRIGREPSTLLQRPGSSHSEAATATTERPTTPADRDSVNFETSPGKSFRTGHSRSASSATAEGSEAQGPFVSKTMDPRRWSPNKASWLESALNRPELPRQTTRPPSQPNWAKDRQSRGSVDLGRVNNFKEVTPIGLMRTPPPGTQTKLPGVSGPSLPTSPIKDGVPESPSGFPLRKSGVLGPSLPASPAKEAVPESPSGSGFPFKKPSISGSSLHRNSVSDPPSEFPLKRPGTAGGSVSGSPEGKLKETVPESPSPFKKSISSASSLHRNSVSEPPAESPLERPSVSGTSVSGSPGKETVPESPSELSFKKPSTSSPSAPGSPEAKSKEIVPQSPSVLGSPDVGQTKEETSASPTPVEEALNALSGGAPAEEHKPASPAEMENESQKVPASEESEPQSTPTRRAPPDSLSPKPNLDRKSVV